jgi:hypothetical protein
MRLCELFKNKRNILWSSVRYEKSDDPYIALLSYRATPLANGHSPAELLMGKKLQTLLPIAPKQLKDWELVLNNFAISMYLEE